MSFNLRHVKYFVAAAQSGQVTRAAVDMNVSQSAVTAAINQLEALLGSKLLIRDKTGVQLTPFGRRFYDQARRVLSSVDDAMRLVDQPEARSPEKRIIRLGVTYTISGYFVTPLLNRLEVAFPWVDFQMQELPRDRIETELADGKLDLALILTSNLENQALAHMTLVSSPRRLWVATSHPLAGRRSVSLRDIEQDDYIALTIDEALITQKRYWRRLGFTPRIKFVTSSVEAVRTMVAAGSGVTILSDMVYRPWSLEGQHLERVDIDELIPPMDVGVAWSHTEQLDPHIADVIAHLSKS
ncbi:MAG: LysR family transcriptional regulator [Pseudomonadota bacterium]|nr:LysR family transcriptional regulator [Pseudomonadota bacterium]